MATKGKSPKAAKAEETKMARPLPWWGKVLAGTLIGFLLVKYTPILDCLTMFFYIVMVPVMMLGAIGLISAGAMEGLTMGWKDTVEQINKRVNEKVSAAA